MHSVCARVRAESEAPHTRRNTFAPEFHDPRETPAPHWYEDRSLVATLDGAVFGGASSAGAASRDVAHVVASFHADASGFPAGLEGPFSLALWSGAGICLPDFNCQA
jgi:hypothetical protein